MEEETKYTFKFIEDDEVYGVFSPKQSQWGYIPFAWFATEQLAEGYCQMMNTIKYGSIWRGETTPLREIYEKYKHLDEILMDSGFDDGGMQRPIMRECWQAIKKVLGV
jgi:hypothetical protein